jgi:hypothetical protein
MSELVLEKAALDDKITALKTLVKYEITPRARREVIDAPSFIGRIKEVLSQAPGSTSTQVRDRLMASGYTRPRAGGPIKRHEVPIALGRLTKAGEVKRIGGDKVHGFEYAVRG